MTELCVKGLSLSIDDHDILKGVDLTVGTGELVVILGSNGAGKSSLLKCALGLIKNFSGSVSIDGRAIETLSPIEKALKLSYLPQKRPMAWPILVKDVVSLGRFAYGANIGKLAGKDEAAVERAIQQCDLTEMKNRSINTLSGGETARVHCARTFAAQAPLLFADEPTTALDPLHQLEIMSLMKSYIDDEHGALVVAHEPALAARFADRLVWMKDGQIVADGPPSETLTTAILASVYGIRAKVMHHEDRPAIDILGPI